MDELTEMISDMQRSLDEDADDYDEQFDALDQQYER